MITAHGASDKKRAALHGRGLRVVDGTRPLGRHAHEQLKRLVASGYFPVVIGKAGHVEVRGLIEGFREARVVEVPGDILQLRAATDTASFLKRHNRSIGCAGS
jgi:4-hydroxy-3-methylbut-2-enyl diphosphate reductase